MIFSKFSKALTKSISSETPVLKLHRTKKLEQGALSVEMASTGVSFSKRRTKSAIPSVGANVPCMGWYVGCRKSLFWRKASEVSVETLWQSHIWDGSRNLEQEVVLLLGKREIV